MVEAIWSCQTQAATQEIATYAPKPFREERRDVLLATIRSLKLAAIVIREEGRFSVAQVPVLVRDADDPDAARIEFHVSVGNPFWREVSAGCPALLMVQGPHAYMHPGWYETKKQTGKAVPTWNYVTVHVEGNLSVHRERDWLVRHVESLTGESEAGRPDEWTLADAPPDYLERQLTGIVGLELGIDQLQGVWKMNQHHPDSNKLGIIAGLSESRQAGDLQVASIMQAQLDLAAR